MVCSASMPANQPRRMPRVSGLVSFLTSASLYIPIMSIMSAG